MTLAIWILAQIAMVVVWYIVPTLPAWVVFLPTFVWLCIAVVTGVIAITFVMKLSK
jgi:hypothetical protein